MGYSRFLGGENDCYDNEVIVLMAQTKVLWIYNSVILDYPVEKCRSQMSSYMALFAIRREGK